MYFGYSMLHSVKERKQKEKELYEEHLKNKEKGMTSGDMTQTAGDYTNVTGTSAAPVGYQGQGNGYAHPGAPVTDYNGSGTGVAPAPTYQPGPNPNNPFLPQNQPQGNEAWQQPAQQQQQHPRAGGDGGYDYQERRVRYDDEQPQAGAGGVQRRNQHFAAQYDPYAGREEYGYQDDNRTGGDGREGGGIAGGAVQYPRQEEPAPQRPAYQPPERDEWGRRISSKGGSGYYQWWIKIYRMNRNMKLKYVVTLCKCH